jgi:hypothetical protein
VLKALGRKLNCLGSEDALTASVFGLMRYLSPTLLVEWLKQSLWAHGGTEAADSPWSRLPRLTEAHFWPRYDDTLKRRGQVEPDLVLEFGRAAVIIEAKLHSGKTPAVMTGQDGEETDADQLARQVKATLDYYGHRERAGIEIAALIYVTADLTLPESDLKKSAAAIDRLGLRTPPPVYWLSWSALGPLLDWERAHGELPGSLIAEDLLEYMREAGVLRFRGWRIEEPDRTPPSQGAVYACWSYHARTSRYFDRLSWQENGPGWTYRQP